MNIPEMKMIASCYNVDVRSVVNRGVYLVDQKSKRYTKLCAYGEQSTITKEILTEKLREFVVRKTN